VQRILFVCSGNTCRSPMAAAILKNKNIPGIVVKSAGIYAANGHEASDHVKQVLRNNNISHQHQSTLLTKTEVEWADLILTMTGSHKTAILQQYPLAARKLFTLKEYSGEEVTRDVVDPFGGNLAIYQVTYQELERLIDKTVEKINP
jgi:protein-tyrosine-phosphatase